MMDESMETVLLLALLAGVSMPLGALLARAQGIFPAWLEDELRHSIAAFGGGALLSAVALVLVPEGMESTQVGAAVGLFCAGGLAFFALDRFLAKHQTPAGQLAAMLSDFVPEALALGAIAGAGGDGVSLIAGLMALQNLPEGFNASRELNEAGLSAKRVVLSFLAMAFLGPLAAYVGFAHLAEQPVVIGGIMLLASGGIIYSVFQDIAPQARLERAWAPPLGAVLGFAVGMAGKGLTG